MNGERRTPNGEQQRPALPFVVRRSWFVALVSCAVLGSSFVVPAQEPVFRPASSELVVLPVVVTDKDGRYISDLTAERFTVFDNGRRVPIDVFTNQDTPVTVGLIIDASGSMRPKIAEVIAASTQFARLSNPEDELFAVRFNENVRDLIPNREFLMASDVLALEAAVRSIRPDGRTALYEGIMDGLDHLAKGTRTRKVLVVISDGGDNVSQTRLETVLARARESNAAIYTIGVYDADDVDKNPRVLKSLAETTGGERFLPNSPGELLAACERIAREIRSGYTIGVVPPAQDGTYHRIKLEIDPGAGRKLNVRTRPGYFASTRAAQP
jgi:Ca-activated chloride channel family protein